GMMMMVPAGLLHAATETLHQLANYMEVSYQGTLAQWQAMLRRRPLLPKALEDVKLEKTPAWTLKTPAFVSSVPASVLPLKDDSTLSLKMGFMSDGARTVWGIEDVRWEADPRHESAVTLWRRAEPPADTQIEIRNQFDSIRARRSPYDGSWSRDSETTLAVTRILDVPGKMPGSTASNPAYGLTVRLARLHDPAAVQRSITDVVAVTKILERGTGSATPPSVAGADGSNAAPTSELTMQEQDAMAEATSMDRSLGMDIRGLHVSDDMRDLIASVDAEVNGVPAGNTARMRQALDEMRLRLGWLRSYWNESYVIVHSREMWGDFLAKNHMPSETAHTPAVTTAESALSSALSRPLSAEWGERARALRVAYVDERSALVKTARGGEPVFVQRTTPCLPAVTTTSGNKNPKPGQAGRSLEDLWPIPSRRLGEEGTVVAALQISSSGCVTATAIVGSSGSGWLDGAVRDYFESMTFLPGEIDGKPIDTQVRVPVVFKLNNDKPAWVAN
ncbi:MAG TPA: energy transducer TonB, partial [Chloroflexota bacterium]|nr:energy transducer TonB [Chloroflexota bacterium]